MREICQKELWVKPWAGEHTRRLPGLNPVAPGEWLLVDDAYAAQMAYKSELLATHRADVLRADDMAGDALAELLGCVLDELRDKLGFTVTDAKVTCPDGRVVRIDPDAPLQTCGALVQEDLCLMQKQGDEHVLTAALLCFPASWSLEQKFMRPLTMIHVPVPSYDAEIARRVQRLFDGIRVERPMWRANYLTYSDPDLFQPRRMEARRKIDPDGPRWMRVERQGLKKLAKSGAVVFSIHTYVVPYATLSPEDIATLG